MAGLATVGCGPASVDPGLFAFLPLSITCSRVFLWCESAFLEEKQKAADNRRVVSLATPPRFLLIHAIIPS